jgi:deoxyribodipyrimidine photo-lyase
MSAPPTIVWFRHDLRISDQPALNAAAQYGGPVIPLFIRAPEEEGDWPRGAAGRWWLHQSLSSLALDLEKRNSRLILRHGKPLEVLRELVRQTGAKRVVWNRRYEPAAVARDTQIKSALARDGIDCESFNASLLHEPWEIMNSSGRPFQVYTPFWRRCLSRGEPAEPLPPPARLAAPRKWPDSRPLKSLALEPRIPWADGIRNAWEPGEAGAAAELRRFLKSAVVDYSVERDRPDRAGTSRLSPYLQFGEIGPRQVWHAVRNRFADSKRSGKRKEAPSGDPYLRQLVWREFAYHLLFHFPETPTNPLRAKFADFPWEDDPQALRAWQQGRTGYPYIDAGMRQLWQTGWMHNRVRMAVGSFLVKDLLIPWQRGAEWFWDTLVDADLANNTLGWQWVAGCGADAAPFFRIFNPVSQGEKFDPDGEYVRRWVPELAALPTRWIHRPWEAPDDVLKQADVVLGTSYPTPIVDHAEARDRALTALKQTAANHRS